MRQVRTFLPLLLLAAASFFGGCSSLTSPPEAEIEPKKYEPPAAVVPARVQPQPTAVPPPTPKEEERVTASHVLISYKGARGAAPNVVRTKDQAKKRAQEVLKKAKGAGKESDFAALAKKYSDDPGSGPKGGDLGPFTRVQMVKPFSDAAFSLRPNEVSEIVESDFGFHVIKRTQ